ncbi:DUF4440 domain-containing protein [Flavitalea antarctica]
MRNLIILLVVSLTITNILYGQNDLGDSKSRKDLHALIDKYSKARENRDTVLLKEILTNDIDQLVSNGEWRTGIVAAVKGMLNSSATTPGTRTLIIEKIKLLNPGNAIIDCRYEIQNATPTPRKMWSTFIVVSEKGSWKISAIRNMLPVAS